MGKLTRVLRDAAEFTTQDEEVPAEQARLSVAGASNSQSDLGHRFHARRAIQRAQVPNEILRSLCCRNGTCKF